MNEYYITRTNKYNLIKKNGTLAINIISHNDYRIIKDIYDKIIRDFYSSDEQLYREIYNICSENCILKTF